MKQAANDRSRRDVVKALLQGAIVSGSHNLDTSTDRLCADQLLEIGARSDFRVPTETIDSAQIPFGDVRYITPAGENSVLLVTPALTIYLLDVSDGRSHKLAGLAQRIREEVVGPGLFGLDRVAYGVRNLQVSPDGTRVLAWRSGLEACVLDLKGRLLAKLRLPNLFNNAFWVSDTHILFSYFSATSELSMMTLHQITRERCNMVGAYFPEQRPNSVSVIAEAVFSKGKPHVYCIFGTDLSSKQNYVSAVEIGWRRGIVDLQAVRDFTSAVASDQINSSLGSMTNSYSLNSIARIITRESREGSVHQLTALVPMLVSGKMSALVRKVDLSCKLRDCAVKMFCTSFSSSSVFVLHGNSVSKHSIDS